MRTVIVQDMLKLVKRFAPLDQQRLVKIQLRERLHEYRDQAGQTLLRLH